MYNSESETKSVRPHRVHPKSS
ncbi:hypothetical protein CR513_57160 [Mucuna pruriens]|uniref:Uncharacterized protein n=1 Tax=Mucuna pruriens TaxID=157652 RepID=A0A371EE43_MUCPR|nr:hypothetical protein CR513_57160 [Mucuna pruriens]